MAFADTEPALSPAAAAIRAKLMDDLAEVPDFAVAANKTPRTIFSYIAQGLPVTYIGRTPYVRIKEASDWLHSRRQRRIEPRGSGRPRKAA